MNIKIKQLERKPEHDGIIRVYWEASKTDKEYFASTHGCETFEPDSDSPDFIPFDQLTEADVVGWLVGLPYWLKSLENTLDKQIENSKNPIVLYGVPWLQNEGQL